MTSSRLLFTGLNSGETRFGWVVGGDGLDFVLEDGRRLLDASNTAGPLGHGHPEIVAAVREAATAPVINEGWPYLPREDTAEELIEVAFAGEDWVGAVRFFLSGSEANDLACSLAQVVTGRSKLAARERAYHGMTGLSRDLTLQPHWHGGVSRHNGGVREAPAIAEVVELPRPEANRLHPAPDPGQDAERVRGVAADLNGVAAVIVDYTQGGTYHSAAYQDALAAEARQAGSLWIADEVVTGLGRMGGWFAFQQGSSRPDIVTLGKPLAGGGAPAGAVVLSQDLVDALSGSSWQTYSTFRGHPIMLAATRAHLRILQRDGLVERANELDALLERRLRAVAEEHPSVARIDGRGLHWTIELHGPDWRTWHGDVPEAPIASRVAQRAVDAGVLIGTSGEQTSLFLAPPLIVSDEDVDRIVQALDHGLEVADREHEATHAA